MNLLNKIFGDGNEKYLKSLQPPIEKINTLEKSYADLSQADLKAKAKDLKRVVAGGKALDDILPEAFALVREAAKRTLNQKHYDVQLIGGLVLHQGGIAEMKTGEGKTLVATLPAFLNALAGKGVHVITVNDYLSRRDMVWMGQIYNYLGLSVSCLQHDSAFLYDETFAADQKSEEERDRGVVVPEKFLKPASRKEAYLADITYGTNNEFGFDYLRDNMVQQASGMVQRGLNYAIIDEVDSILIDEARTPLIISAPAEESTDKYYQFAKLVRILNETADYNIDEKLRACSLTEEGITKIEKSLGVENIYESHGLSIVHHLEEALKAETIFKRDRDYVVKDGEVIIVDEFTGRLMFGRRYSGGLHQAIEAKEGVKIQRESVTMATITFQNYFRMYPKLAGMTGTAATEAEEFAKIYNLDVTVIPTNKPMIRKDSNDRIYKNEAGKFTAAVKEIKERNQKGQPVLIGTISIEKNELLSQFLSREGIRHELLNAKNHAREAEILAQAGRPGAVTLATNMAGRGVAIILGGNPVNQAEQQKVIAAGGLHVIGTERHESRRIDNQLRGRSGRQGDPGSSQFFVCLDDDLMRIFGSDRMKSLMNTLKVPEDLPIENRLISKSIESAQKRVEGNNFDIRKHLVEYDDVLNKQRTAIYRKRRLILDLAEGQHKLNANQQPAVPKNVLEADAKTEQNEPAKYRDTREIVLDYVNREIEQIVDVHLAENSESPEKIFESLETICPFNQPEKDLIGKSLAKNPAAVVNQIQDLAKEKYVQMEESISHLPQLVKQKEPLRQLEKYLLLRTIDSLWIEHLEAIEHLRTGIGLRGYGQREPLIEYKKESFLLFQQLLSLIQEQVARSIFKMGLAATVPLANQPRGIQQIKSSLSQFNRPAEKNQADNSAQGVSGKIKDVSGHKIGRNDPCPCGATKADGSPVKYKHCHGQ